MTTYSRRRRNTEHVPVLRDQRREPLRAQRDPLGSDSGRARSGRASHPRGRKQSWLGRFVSTYGWRAYALPVLTTLTAVVIYQTVAGTNSPAPAARNPNQHPSSAEASETAIFDAPPRGLAEFDANLPTGMLPEGGPFTQAGDKTWHVVPGTEPQVGQGSVKVVRYTVEVEDGIDATAFGGDDVFAAMVDQTLTNPKGWTHNPQFAFIRIDTGKPDLRISLTSPMTVRAGCGYEFELETSCYNPSYPASGRRGQPRVFINEARWVRGAIPFEGDVGSYRQYVINHEVGHAVGHLHHEPCEKQGGLAPVMMQQTFSTSDDDLAKFDPDFVKADGKTCRYNPWPYPIA